MGIPSSATPGNGEGSGSANLAALIAVTASVRLALAAMILVPLGLLSLVRHWELRYLQSVIPFVCLVVAVGACRLFSLGCRNGTLVLLFSSLPYLAGGLTFLARTSRSAAEAIRRIATEPGGSLCGSVAVVGLRCEPRHALNGRRQGPARAAHARGAGGVRPGV